MNAIALLLLAFAFPLAGCLQTVHYPPPDRASMDVPYPDAPPADARPTDVPRRDAPPRDLLPPLPDLPPLLPDAGRHG